MDRIELEPLDKKDLEELLDYCLHKKIEENDDLALFWKGRIEQLKMIVNGYVRTPGIQSSMLTMDKHLKPREMKRLRESMENDLIDLLDYFEEKKGDENLYT